MSRFLRFFFNDRITLSLTTIRNKWFFNLSSVYIPTNIQCLLQLGDNFVLLLSGGRTVVMEFMKNVENNIRKLLSSVHYNVRNHLLAIINNLLSFKSKNNSIRHRLTKLVQCTKQFLKKNRNIIFTKAAKAT